MAVKSYGYIRVSSKDQNEQRQVIALNAAGVSSEHIYVEKASGKNFERPQYKKLLQKMRCNDVLYIKSIDRLGRNYAEILEQWRYLTKRRRIDVVVIDMPLLDTRLGKDLMGTFIADLVLQILSFVAENERMNIRERQAEGIAAAKARGVRFGRPVKPLLAAFRAAVHRWRKSEITATAAAKQCGMPVSTFLYKAKRYCGEGEESESE